MSVLLFCPCGSTSSSSESCRARCLLEVAPWVGSVSLRLGRAACGSGVEIARGDGRRRGLSGTARGPGGCGEDSPPVLEASCCVRAFLLARCKLVYAGGVRVVKGTANGEARTTFPNSGRKNSSSCSFTTTETMGGLRLGGVSPSMSSPCVKD